MKDILLEKNNGFYDISFENGDFKTTDGLDTSIINSLLVDKRANNSEITESDLRRGWLGNELNDDNDYEVGSKLWLIYQARNNQDAINKAIDHSQDCLFWMKEDSLIKDSVVDASSSGNGITIDIEFIRFDNSTFKKQFELWDNTNLV